MTFTTSNTLLLPSIHLVQAVLSEIAYSKRNMFKRAELAYYKCRIVGPKHWNLTGTKPHHVSNTNCFFPKAALFNCQPGSLCSAQRPTSQPSPRLAPRQAAKQLPLPTSHVSEVSQVL